MSLLHTRYRRYDKEHGHCAANHCQKTVEETIKGAIEHTYTLSLAD